jgi:hypothetical protein
MILLGLAGRSSRRRAGDHGPARGPGRAERERASAAAKLEHLSRRRSIAAE